MMKNKSTSFIVVLQSIFFASTANADIAATTLSCKQNSLSWKAEFKIDKSRKTILGLRFFNYSDGRPDGRNIQSQGKSRVTLHNNGTVKWLAYGLYNDVNKFNRFEFYEMMGKLEMNGRPFAKCVVSPTRIVSRSTSSGKPTNASPAKSTSESTQQIFSQSTARYKTKKWSTEWTNPDGSKSKTNVTFSNKPNPDGRLGTYDWSNGRFLGIWLNKGAGFEGRWVQDKSGQRCKDLVGGSFYHGKAWFKLTSKRAFVGKWSYCNQEPKLDWVGWQ